MFRAIFSTTEEREEWEAKIVRGGSDRLPDPFERDESAVGDVNAGEPNQCFLNQLSTYI